MEGGNKANDYNSQDLCLPLRLLLPKDISTDCINDWKKNKEWTRYVSKTYCCIPSRWSIRSKVIAIHKEDVSSEEYTQWIYLDCVTPIFLQAPKPRMLKRRAVLYFHVKILFMD